MAVAENSSKGIAVLEGFSNLTILRQLGLLIGLAASVALGVGVVLWTKEPTFRPLSYDVSNLDASQIADILQTEKILYKVDTNTGMILVESARIHDARMKLASSGVTLGGHAGYELLDKESNLGSSQFLENARYHRSIEGELAKTIASVNSIHSARVHLAIPKNRVFLTDQQDIRASVLVDLFPGQLLGPGQVSAIVSLVSSSVPGLDPKNITVVDQKGTLLTNNSDDPAVRLANKEFDYVRKIENLYMKRVENILLPVLGVDKFKVELTADVDFTRTAQTNEEFKNEKQPVVRSEQILDEQHVGSASAGGVPGALSNQPPAAGESPEKVAAAAATQTQEKSAQPKQTKKQELRNYEVNRTISHIENPVGVLKKLSVAVVVDNKEERVTVDKKEEVKSIPLAEDDLKKLDELVKNAIGFDQERGDQVQVSNQVFFKDPNKKEQVIPSIPIFEQPWFWDIAKQGIGGLLVLGLLLGVLRPILKNLANIGESDRLIETNVLDSGSMSDFDEETAGDISGGPESFLLSVDNSYEGQLNAVKSLIAEDPKRVAQVVKQWIQEAP